MLLRLLVLKPAIAAVAVMAQPRSRPTSRTAQALTVFHSSLLKLKHERVSLRLALARTGLNGVLIPPAPLLAGLFYMTEPLPLEPGAMPILLMPVDFRSENAAATLAM